MIFVFSGTGNSYAAAKRISEAIGTGMIDIAAAVRYKRYTYDAKREPVGFVFPTYYYGLPRMVLEFARNVTVLNPGRVFAVTTCGEESGGACEMLAEELGNRLRVDASYDVVMPDNSVFAFDPPTNEQAEETLRAADAEIDRIIGSIKAGESGDMCAHKGDKDWREIYALYDEQRVTEPFRITDACIECRICEDICPALQDHRHLHRVQNLRGRLPGADHQGLPQEAGLGRGEVLPLHGLHPDVPQEGDRVRRCHGEPRQVLQPDLLREDHRDTAEVPIALGTKKYGARVGGHVNPMGFREDSNIPAGPLNPDGQRFETVMLHAGQETPDPSTGARATPLYLTTSYVFGSCDEAADIFAMRKPGNF